MSNFCDCLIFILGVDIDYYGQKTTFYVIGIISLKLKNEHDMRNQNTFQLFRCLVTADDRSI